MTHEPDKQVSMNYKKAFIHFLLVIPVLILVLTLLSRVENMELSNEIKNIEDKERQYLTQQTRLVETLIDQVKKDVRFLASFHATKKALINGTCSMSIRELFINTCNFYGNYNQILLVSKDGKEILKVEKEIDDCMAPITDHPTLEEEDYLIKSLNVPQGEVYISPMRLSMEDGEISSPYKPIIYVGTPVYNDEEKLGAVVLEFMGEIPMNLIELLRMNVYGKVYVINQDGYWFKGLKKDDEWGFMFPSGEGKTIFNRFPLEAKKIYSKEFGQFKTDEGLFSFSTIHPMGSKEYYWKILSIMTEKEIDKALYNIKSRYRFFGAITLSAIIMAAFMLAIYFENRRVTNDRIRLETLLDPLTGLWNRRYMMDRLSEELQRLARYGGEATIVVIDLGNFKKVNDLLGHATGDKVLIEVGHIFEDSLRRCDVVSRHGGDEFLLYFPSTSEENSRQVMKRLAQKVQDHIRPGANIEVVIDWGVKSLSPYEGIDRAIRIADDRMYAYKKARKSRDKDKKG